MVTLPINKTICFFSKGNTAHELPIGRLVRLLLLHSFWLYFYLTVENLCDADRLVLKKKEQHITA